MIYFTADLHLDHEAVLSKFSRRPYTTLTDMRRDFKERYNAIVKPTDIGYFLGDIGLYNPDKWDSYIHELNGLKKCVRGNHDASPSKLIEAGFHSVVDQDFVQSNGFTLWLSHIPINNVSDKRRLMRPEPLMPYDIALCGHVHDRWKFGPDDEINVGVDVWDYKPIGATQIVLAYLSHKASQLG